MTKKVTTAKGSKPRAMEPKEPKKLSKIGKWMRAHPNGIGEILDMRTVMK